MYVWTTSKKSLIFEYLSSARTAQGHARHECKVANKKFGINPSPKMSYVQKSMLPNTYY